MGFQVGHRLFACAWPGLILATLGGSTVAAQTITDEFTHELPAHWFVCNREENGFSFGVLPGENRAAMTATVRPRMDLLTVGLLVRHKGCRDDDGHYVPDSRNERAELWEADPVWLPVGTDIWYRYDMFIDGSIPTNAGRVVIGQWKQNNAPGNASPVLAQRFSGRTFIVTIEQDNDDPGRNPMDTQCRIVVAAQASSANPPGAGTAHGLLALSLADLGGPKITSFGHDLSDVSNSVDGRLSAVPGCARDVSVATYNPLPDPFNNWTTMVYHLRIGADGSGLVEIWANGKKISRTTGRVGFRAPPTGGKQYFKFGPYRDHASYVTMTRLSHYMRSASRQEIDPDGTLAPN